MPSAFASAVVRSGARAELDMGDVPVARRLLDRLDELGGIDVVARPRLRRADAIAGHDELRVVRTDDPLPEARTHEGRELVAVEGDRELRPVGVHAQRVGELRPRECAAARPVEVDRDGSGEQRVDLRDSTSGGRCTDRGPHTRKRCVDDEVVVDQPLQ